ncbi:MAG TPA: MFS transporter, partial [Urbifossiella sp.]|nr:MFS transporter [Urbifossiella sp.]
MSAPSPIAPWRWSVVWLLFLATMLNYMDRLALNNTQRYLLAEFEPDPANRNAVYADIQFAFGVSFALFQVVAGFLIDRFSLRWLYLGAIVVWSGAGVLTGFVPAGAVGALIACRVVLGVGEAFNWPCAVACVRRVIPRESRGLANGIFHSGASIGAVATPFLVLLAVNRETGDGWRVLFVAVGAVGAGWAVLWMLATRGDRAAAIDSVAAAPTCSSAGTARQEETHLEHPSPPGGGVATSAHPGAPTSQPNPPGPPPSLRGKGGDEPRNLLAPVSANTASPEGTPREHPGSLTFGAVFGLRMFWVCLTTGVCVNLCWHFYNQWFPRYLTEDLRVGPETEQY